MSKHFRSSVILRKIKEQFKELWISNVKTSPKLEFYGGLKTEFIKEDYLDLIKNYDDRSNLTKLRISSHHLAIEKGRYENKERHNRICLWCNLSLGIDTVECEEHFLNDCDLYAINRNITSQKIKNIAPSTICTYFNPNQNVIKLQVTPQCNNTAHQDHKTNCELLDHHKASFYQIVSHFITISFNRRKKFLQPQSGVT